jgi:hypothetical protein
MIVRRVATTAVTDDSAGTYGTVRNSNAAVYKESLKNEDITQRRSHRAAGELGCG